MIREGYMSFYDNKTYYRITGDLQSGKAPLILLHGGPGSTHNYFELLDPLAERTNRAIVMYDQVGCGNSYVEGRPELWRMETWIEELQCLRTELGLDTCHLLGQSWGGMLLLEYICRYHPEGVASIILSSTLPSSQLWGQEQHRMIQFMPEDMQEAIAAAEASDDYTDLAYQRAEAEFMRRHCADAPGPDAPECLRRPKKSGRESYVVAWGPNEFTPAGTLKEYDVTELLSQIQQPALIISGGNDLCTPYIAKTMYDAIPSARWELFRTCRHACYAEDTEHYMQVVADWLRDKA